MAEKSMEIGIFSRTYETDSLKEAFEKMTARGIFHTQLNLCSAGLKTLPETIEEGTLEQIRMLAGQYGVRLSALSGTFNMIDPDEERRRAGCRCFETVCQAAKFLEIPVVTLCTGSKHPQDKWSWHPDNLLSSSWDDLLRTTELLLRYAESYGVVLGVEPETGNIICSAQKARDYLDSMKSSRLKIVIDAANLFVPEDVSPAKRPRMRETIREAFSLLGRDVALAHAKDIASPSGADDGGRETQGMSYTAPGLGILDFDFYLGLLLGCGYTGPLIMHGLTEEQVPYSVDYFTERLGGCG